MITLNLKIPTAYNQLTEKELKFVGWLYAQELPESDFLTYAFLYFAGLKIEGKAYRNSNGGTVKRYRRGKQRYWLTSNQIAEHARSLEWLKNIRECRPIHKIRGRKVCHPRLYGVPLRQYLTIENYHQAYAQKKDDDILDYLLASIYALPWQRFRDDKVRKRAKAYHKVSLDTKLAVFLWYAGVRSFLKDEYPNLFQAGGTGKPEMKKQFRSILRGLNKGNIAENERILNSDTHDGLAELDAMIEEQEERKKKLKK